MPLVVNSGLPLLEISSAAPNIAKKEKRWPTGLAEPARLVPAVELGISTQLERLGGTYDQVMAASVVEEVCEDGFKWG